MKKSLLFLLLVFLLADAYLAVRVFKPSILRIQNPFGKQSVTIESEVPSLTPRIVNEQQLDKKLSELNFWDNKRVNNFKIGIEKVTVKNIVLKLTDEPQHWGRRLEKTSSNKAIYSYGQSYDPESQTMTILLQLDRSYLPERSLDQRYSALATYAFYDLTYNYPKNQEKYDRGLKQYIQDYVVNQDRSNFIKFDAL